jgi:hypothetical protein
MLKKTGIRKTGASFNRFRFDASAPESVLRKPETTQQVR